jgi:tetratricopeptide (TPR) repeat protein
MIVIDFRQVIGLTKEQLEACQAKGAIIDEDQTISSSLMAILNDVCKRALYLSLLHHAMLLLCYTACSILRVTKRNGVVARLRTGAWPMTRESMKAVEVFYSYAHKDEKLRTALMEHLSTLRRQGYISEWHDRQIVAGTDWAQEIDAHLQSASLILLLISPSFIASDYCYGIEMQLAFERHQAGQARVIPIILRPTDLKDTPFAALKFLPVHGKAITTWQNRDEAFLDVARGIRTAIEDLSSSTASAQPPVQSLARPLWNIPYRRNPLYTGREHIFERLATMFHTGETSASAQPLAISGLGGIGKTQLAIEYAYRYREYYQQVLWARADTRENLIQEYVAIAEILQLPQHHLQDQPQIVDAVMQWLREQPQWLLILDNADDLGMLRNFLPETYTGHILLTTRAQAIGRVARRIELDRMEQEEGILFLLRRAGILDIEEPLEKASSRDQANALTIFQEMDGLPLALDQAGAYIEETACGLTGYLTRYQQRQTELLQARGEYISDHPESVATTWSLSFEKVEQANPVAADLLRLCAFLAPDAIPEEIVTEGAAELTPVLQSLASDPFLLDVAIKALLRYSLIKRNAEENRLSLHRLVQVVLKDAMSEEVQRAWAELAVRTVNRAFPAVEFETLPRCREYLPHALACAELIEQHHFAFQEAAELLHRVGSYLVVLARYDKAESFLQRALHISEQTQGLEHLDTATMLHTLAWLYQDRGKYEEAESLYQRALRIREQQFGPEHLDVATSLNGLGHIYYQQGKYGEAEPLYQRALRIREQQLGPEHPEVALSLKALANLYYQQGRYGEVEPLHQRTLRIWEQQFGPEHPDVAAALNNLAFLYFDQGKYEESEPLYQRALRIWEQQFGPEHPLVAYPLTGLAGVYHQQGEYGEAEPLYRRALHIREQALEAEHPDTTYTLLGLARLYHDQGKYAQAEPLYQRALHIHEQVLGPEHSDTAKTLLALADFYHDQGKYAEAEPLYQRILAMKEQTIVPDHLSIAFMLEKYATLLRQMQRPEEAAQLEERARELRVSMTS